MTRAVPFALAFFTTAAHAATGAVYIDDATDKVHLSVANVSGSPDVEDRLFQVTTAPVMMHADGSFGCPAGTTADSIQLAFGKVIIQGDQLIPFAWATSPAMDLGGAPFGSFSIDYPLDLQESWDPDEDLITLGYNGAYSVHMAYQFAEQGNADMVQWMQSDMAFEDGFTMNVVLWCDDGQELIPGVDSVPVDVSILYSGDRGIQYQPVAGTPGDVDSGTTEPPGYDSSTTGGSDPTTGHDTTTDTTTRR